MLQAALVKLGTAVKTHVMNPKSMPRTQLLGEMDLDTREWSDGVLTDAARSVVREPPSTRCWIVCDGDVDPEWIESLNSVLDDNHLLTLPNGERISFGANVNFLFETHDLRFASPATARAPRLARKARGRGASRDGRRAPAWPRGRSLGEPHGHDISERRGHRHAARRAESVSVGSGHA